MDIFFLTLFAVCAALACKIIVRVYTYYITWKKLSRIPGPIAVPVIGTLELLKVTTGEEKLKFFLELGNRYKDGISIVWTGPVPSVCLYDPNFIQVVLSSNIHINKPFHTMLLSEWLGDGLFTATDKQWHKDRKLLTPAFHFSILEQYTLIMSERAEIMTKRFEEKIAENPQQAIDIIPYITKTTADIILETAMDITSYKDTSEYIKAINRYVNLHFKRMNNWIYYFIMEPVYALLPIARQTKAAAKCIHKLANEVIQTKKLARSMQNGKIECVQNEVSGKSRRKTFLDILLDLKDSGDTSLSDDKVRAQVDTFFFAGYDTTKTSICWVLFCLGNYLECQEKIHEELEEMFKDSQGPATVQEISQLKYLDRVIKETRRLYPTAACIVRKVSHETKIGDYTIPTDTEINISMLLLHRNPAIWPDPLKFDPDRFLPENMGHKHPYAYIPFSAGPRNCIGQRYAMLQEKILLTAILRKWRIKCVETPENMRFKSTITLTPTQSIHIHFIPKN